MNDKQRSLKKHFLSCHPVLDEAAMEEQLVAVPRARRENVVARIQQTVKQLVRERERERERERTRVTEQTA